MRGLLLGITLVAASVAIGQSPPSAKQQVDEALRLASQSFEAKAQRRWARAAELRAEAYKLLYVNPGVVAGDPVRWQEAAEIGWLYLMNLDKEPARQYFESVIKAVAASSDAKNSLEEVRARMGRARALEGLRRLAEMDGDYARAGELQKLAASEYRIRCGVHAASVAAAMRLEEGLFAAAAGKTAKEALERIRNSLDLPSDVPAWLLPPYRERAGFFLAEIHFREGNKAEAIKLFREIFFKPDGNELYEMLARSYLDKLYGRK